MLGSLTSKRLRPVDSFGHVGHLLIDGKLRIPPFCPFWQPGGCQFCAGWCTLPPRSFGGAPVACFAARVKELLKGWQRLGVSFSGVILQAEHKETVKEYAA